jgi:hypothetical protein
MFKECSFTETSRFGGWADGLFLSPWGEVFACGNINYLGRTLIATVDQEFGQWSGEAESFRLSNISYPNASSFVRQLLFLSGSKVMALGRFEEGGIALFDRTGRRDEEFSRKIQGLVDPFTTILGGAVLGRDKAIVFGMFNKFEKGGESRGPQAFTVSIEGDWEPVHIGSDLVFEKVFPLPDGRALVILKKSGAYRKYDLFVVSEKGEVDMSRRIYSHTREFAVSVSPSGRVMILFRDNEYKARVYLIDEQLCNLVECATGEEGEESLRPTEDSLALWLSDKRILFCACDLYRSTDGLVLDLDGGLDASLVGCFSKDGMVAGYNRIQTTAALYLPERGRVLISERYQAENEHVFPERISRLGFANIA